MKTATNNQIEINSKIGQPSAQRGRVIAFCPDVGAGVIRSADGNQYVFRKSEWRMPTPPASNMIVAFLRNQRAAYDVSLAEAV